MMLRYILFPILISLAACNTFTHTEETPPTPPPLVMKQEVIKRDSVKKQIAYNPVPKDSVSYVTITLVGDLMSHIPQINNARKADGTYDFTPSFEYVRTYLSAADLTVGNLETTCAGSKRPYAGYPAFNTPDEYIAALKYAGFDLLVTANNHSMDTEEEGLLRTIDIVKKNGLGYTGTHTTQRDRDSVRVFELKGLKIGFLNYTYGTNGILPKPDHKYMLNVIDTVLIKNDIASARKSGAEVVLVFFHYGLENIAEPTADQKFIVNKTKEYGADIIIGAHPHVVGPTDYFTTYNATLDTGFVAYSMGNFISNQNWRYTDAGVIVNLKLEKNFTKKKTRIGDVSYIPTWVYRSTGSRKGHTVIPAELALNDSLPSFIDADSKRRMLEAFEDTKKIMTKYTDRVQLKSVK